eukprot:scaffold60_cov325-Pavlova_lutheri.AAC.18
MRADAVVSVAGRVVAKRVFGKLAFFKINDESGDIQLYLDKKRMDAYESGVDENANGAFQHVKQNVDVGDIVGATGGIKRTEKGELSVHVSQMQVLTKSLLPLPDKWHGLQDVEKRYRQRYVDLIVNPSVKDTFRKRAAVVSHFRSFLERREYLEFETPVLESAAGGADAKPFLTYHNALGKNLSLRIATELHLKRLVVGGFERVYEIGRIFRNEGISTRHNPEFTSIEVYQAYADYQDMMRLTEEIVSTCAEKVCGSTTILYQGETIDLTPPFRRATMHDLVRSETGLALEGSDTLERAKEKALEALDGRQVTQGTLDAVRGAPTKGHLVNEIFEGAVEQTLMQPTFVMDHPVEISPLAKPHRKQEGLVERFELFVYGRELANAFSELTDPLEQRKRLQAQIETHRSMKEQELRRASGRGEDAYNRAKNEDYDVILDEDFITALEHGMPPTAGMGLGIDRLVMLLTDSPSIRDPSFRATRHGHNAGKKRIPSRSSFHPLEAGRTKPRKRAPTALLSVGSHGVPKLQHAFLSCGFLRGIHVHGLFARKHRRPWYALACAHVRKDFRGVRGNVPCQGRTADADVNFQGRFEVSARQFVQERSHAGFQFTVDVLSFGSLDDQAHSQRDVPHVLGDGDRCNVEQVLGQEVQALLRKRVEFSELARERLQSALFFLPGALHVEVIEQLLEHADVKFAAGAQFFYEVRGHGLEERFTRTVRLAIHEHKRKVRVEEVDASQASNKQRGLLRWHGFHEVLKPDVGKQHFRAVVFFQVFFEDCFVGLFPSFALESRLQAALPLVHQTGQEEPIPFLEFGQALEEVHHRLFAYGIFCQRSPHHQRCFGVFEERIPSVGIEPVSLVRTHQQVGHLRRCVSGWQVVFVHPLLRVPVLAPRHQADVSRVSRRCM